MGVQVPPPAPINFIWNSMTLSVQKVREQDAVIDFKATIDSSEYETELNSWLSKKSETARIDGFRPGKAPLTVIKKLYGDDASRSVVNTLIDRVLRTIDKEHQIRVAGHPSVTVEKADAAEGFECSVTVECLPKIELKDFSSISCEQLVIDISKKEIDEAVENLFSRYKGHEKDPKDGKAAWGDKVKFSIKEQNVKSESQEQDLVLEENIEEELWRPLHQGLEGKSAGDKVEVVITYPEDFHQATVASKSFTYELEIHSVYARIEFKLDDTFAKEFECENLDALHAKMKSTLETDQNHLIGLFHKRQILDALNDQYQMPLPKSSIDFEFEQIWKRLQDEIAAAKERGEKEDIDLEEVEVEYRQIAERRVKLGLLVSEIAKVHSISLSKEEIQREVMIEAMKYKSQFNEVVDYYIKNPRMMEKLIAPALEDKVVEFVLEKAKKKETKITVKELPAKLKGIVPGYEDDDEVEASDEKKASKEGKSVSAKPQAKNASPKVKGE